MGTKRECLLDRPLTQAKQEMVNDVFPGPVKAEASPGRTRTTDPHSCLAQSSSTDSVLSVQRKKPLYLTTTHFSNRLLRSKTTLHSCRSRTKRALKERKKRASLFRSEPSQVSVKERGMPNVGPRVALVQAIRKSNYLATVAERDTFVNGLLLDAVTFLNFGSTLDLGDDGCDVGDTDNPVSSEIGRALFYQYLNAAMHFSVDQRFKKRILILLLKHRYLDARVPLPKTMDWLNRVLPASPDHVFQHHVRMTRRSFGMLTHLLTTKAGRFFGVGRRGRKQLPVETQLHMALYCIGFYGNGAGLEQARCKFGYGVGTVKNSRDRVVNALFSLVSDFITWPSASERRRLCRRVREKHGFHHAFFAVDGTTHPFAFTPKYDSSSWYDRKSRYSMQALVTNDIDMRVINLVVGWPGSAHDARVLQSADFMSSEKTSVYFTGPQHGLGDAAFGVYHRVIPNFKEPLASLPENVVYNKAHSSFRIRSEHTIGAVKNRFQGVKEVRLRLRRKENVEGIVKFITSSYVLHNILLSFGDDYKPEDGEESDDERRDELRLGDEGVQIEGVQIDSPSVVQSAKEFRETVKGQVLRFVGFE